MNLKKIFMVFSAGILMNPIWANQREATHNGDITPTIKGNIGNFKEDKIPIKLNIPQGFKFIDSTTSREFLINYYEKPDSTIADVFGMVIPDTTSVVDNIDRGWILYYLNVGHVDDTYANNFGCDWIKKSIINKIGDKSTLVKWTWTPEYDTSNHSLSIPLTFVTANDTVLNHRHYIFGNTGAILIESFAPPSATQWLADNSKALADGVEFNEGARYENFNSESDKNTYNSIYAFIKGNRTNSATSEDETKDNVSLSLSSGKVIGFIWKPFAILFGIMLLFMLAVAFTNVKRESSKGIMQLVVNVLFRIGVFSMVYLLILTFAFFLIGGLAWVTFVAIETLTYHLSLKLILLLIGGWSFVCYFLWEIIRSLFIFPHIEHPERIEISIDDAPSLYTLVSEISKKMDEKMPKHIYLSPSVNACVFYDKTLIWGSIIGRKTLR